jgi:hypothetical protein
LASGLLRHEALNAAWYRNRFAIAVSCVIVLAVARLFSAGDKWPLGETLHIDAPQPDGGHAYVSKLTRTDLGHDKLPVDAFLYEIHTDRGVRAFDRLNERWGWSLTYLGLRARILAKYPHVAMDRRERIGTGNTHDEDIRAFGGGRYIIWKGSLHFSTSDNSSPVSNGRRYELFVPYFRIQTMSAIAWWLQILALAVLSLTFLRALAEVPMFRPVFANTAPGVLVTVVMLAVAVGGNEIYQRVANKAFGDAIWPMRFDPAAGLTFEPNAEIRWTNQLDFWTRERTNSLGFLDWEPAQPKPAGRFRVMLVGDSFVEGAQLSNAAKVQTLLASRLEEQLGEGRVDVVSIALSGTGQANQIGLYEAFGKPLAPDLVVLLAVSNDFADNSPLLSAVRNGWSPSSPPWFFFERIGAREFRPLMPAEDWARFKLTGVDPVAFHAALMQVPAYASRFGGWGGPAAADMDAMFFRRELPPAFEEAIDLTRHALDEWTRIAERDQFQLVVVATANLTRGEVDALSDGSLYLKRFREIVEKAGVPFLDLYPIFARNPDPSVALWRHDSHWNETGHQWAAEALYRFLTDNRLLPDGSAIAARR